MTRARLAVFCAIGALMWAGIFALLSHFGVLAIDWQEVARWTVMIVLAVFTVGAVWLNVERDQELLDYEEQIREADQYNFDEDDAA
jgi:membrane protein DedA with SNARE-associated domain